MEGPDRSPTQASTSSALRVSSSTPAGPPVTSYAASAVQEAAGQGNKSAVQYHFGDRDGLIQAVMDARMAPANKRRMGMLERLDHLPAELRASLAPDKPGGS